MDVFNGLSIKDGVLKGDHMFFKRSEIEVSFHLEEKSNSIEKFKTLIKISEKRITDITEEKFNNLKVDISKELTDSAYSQSDYKPQKEDYESLNNDLIIKEANFFEDAVTFIFESKKEYPDLSIYCQLDDDWAIEDLFVE